jgi:hypothetical protein
VAVAVVAERTVSVEFVFDRTGAQALAQVYRMLVPERRARAAGRRDSDDGTQGAEQLGGVEPGPGRPSAPAGGGRQRALGA